MGKDKVRSWCHPCGIWAEVVQVWHGRLPWLRASWSLLANDTRVLWDITWPCIPVLPINVYITSLTSPLPLPCGYVLWLIYKTLVQEWPPTSLSRDFHRHETNHEYVGMSPPNVTHNSGYRLKHASQRVVKLVTCECLQMRELGWALIMMVFPSKSWFPLW